MGTGIDTIILNFHAAGIAPVEESSTLEIFLGQKFQSEVCESESAAPVWSIDNFDLINTSILQSFNARVERGYDDATGNQQATLIINVVNSPLNGSVVSCSANSTRILTYVLVVGKDICTYIGEILDLACDPWF